MHGFVCTIEEAHDRQFDHRTEHERDAAWQIESEIINICNIIILFIFLFKNTSYPTSTHPWL
jgi:hypothetical protein